MTINEVAQQAGVRKDTVRFYTKQGLIVCTQKQVGSRLYAEYDAEVVARIICIKKVQALGFSLQEVGTLINGTDGEGLGEQQRHMLQGKLDDIRKKQKELAELANFIEGRIGQ